MDPILKASDPWRHRYIVDDLGPLFSFCPLHTKPACVIIISPHSTEFSAVYPLSCAVTRCNPGSALVAAGENGVSGGNLSLGLSDSDIRHGVWERKETSALFLTMYTNRLWFFHTRDCQRSFSHQGISKPKTQKGWRSWRSLRIRTVRDRGGSSIYSLMNLGKTDTTNFGLQHDGQAFPLVPFSSYRPVACRAGPLRPTITD